jgi:hypothetical protein
MALKYQVNSHGFIIWSILRKRREKRIDIAKLLWLDGLLQLARLHHCLRSEAKADVGRGKHKNVGLRLCTFNCF